MSLEIASLANDPYATYLNISCFDLLLIELVPLAERMARDFEESLDRPSLTEKRITAANTPGASMGTEKEGEGEVFRDSVYFRLEGLGFRVGQGLSERFSRDRPRFTDSLDVIKFLCKDLWMIVFKKQIDNLKTNHRASTEDAGHGVYVLTDNMFRPFSRMSMANRAEAVTKAQPHLYFPCGIIRGALSSLGIKATVQAETTELPTATFQIKTIQAKS